VRIDRLPPSASNRQAVFSFSMMQVRVLGFGVLKDWLGAQETTVELPEGATVAQLLVRLGAAQPLPRGIAVSVTKATRSGCCRRFRAGVRRPKFRV
jgi:sulfur carrier protein ThiS